VPPTVVLPSLYKSERRPFLRGGGIGAGVSRRAPIAEAIARGGADSQRSRAHGGGPWTHPVDDDGVASGLGGETTHAEPPSRARVHDTFNNQGY